jgi:amino acid efflux transporter
MRMLPRTLGLGGGIALAVGSVAGSGILFLPSVVLVIAGSDALVVWVCAALACVPLLLVFGSMVRLVPDGSGLEGFVAFGLGRRVAAVVPALFLVIAFPAGAAATLVAGGYLEAAVGGGAVVRLAGALGIWVVTTWMNLRGAAGFQIAVMWALLVAALALVGLTFDDARGGYDAVAPSWGGVGPVAHGVLVAFWAFAGFENMTFVAGELRNPRRDYLVAVVVALGGYCVLAMLLTANLGAVVPRAEVDELAGLAQLAAFVPGGVAVLAVLALLLVQANTASWTWGLSRLLYSAAREGRLPRWFAVVDRRGLPRRAVLAFTVPTAVCTCAAAVWPGLVLPFVTGASAVFVTLYALAVASFIAIRRAARAERSRTPIPDRSPPDPRPAAGSSARS